MNSALSRSIPAIASLSRPNHLRRRPNRLRPKLPGLTTIPSPSDTATQSRESLLINPDLATSAATETDVAPRPNVANLTSKVLDLKTCPTPSPPLQPVSRVVLDLCFRFALLLAVQTLIAVLFLSNGGGGGAVLEESKDGEDETQRDGSELGLAEVGLEEKVNEIREMVEEAKLVEKKETEEESGIKEEVNMGIDKIRERYQLVNLGNGEDNSRKNNNKQKQQKRNVVISRDKAKSMHAPKGFNRPKKSDYRASSKKAEHSSLHETGNIFEPRESNLHGRIAKETADRKNFAVSSDKESLLSKDCNFSGIVDHINDNVFKAASFMDGKQRPTSVVEKLRVPMSASNFISEVKQYGKVEKMWWQKLSHVLAIYLHRGFDRDNPGGLYKLKSHSAVNGGSSSSYTVAFQDRGDASNFCYLLESYFKELGDVSADVVPLTTKELEEMETSGEEVIVVKKGQVQLYAGQPLSEAEDALRSLANR